MNNSLTSQLPNHLTTQPSNYVTIQLCNHLTSLVVSCYFFPKLIRVVSDFFRGTTRHLQELFMTLSVGGSFNLQSSTSNLQSAKRLTCAQVFIQLGYLELLPLIYSFADLLLCSFAVLLFCLFALLPICSFAVLLFCLFALLLICSFALLLFCCSLRCNI